MCHRALPRPEFGAEPIAISMAMVEVVARRVIVMDYYNAGQGFGQPPNTLAEFALNQFQNLDFFDISLVDGFNIPMEFSPTANGCRHLRCTAPINDQCPNQLRAPGGCNNPCTVFRTNEYCCTNGQGSCGPTTFSRFFKDRCPDAYSYPQDDPTRLRDPSVHYQLRRRAETTSGTGPRGTTTAKTWGVVAPLDEWLVAWWAILEEWQSNCGEIEQALRGLDIMKNY
ncbi:hypothetical protein BUALT_Bualt10G0043600 [Buddleja alternifolia]|uniref:Thaumatin-like protein n=1 Tax=Buddleja alternifolia TaxID=168488 RepID=A0AAV6X435_9LAMI|nr:hypothetical protein BUALT_Bualt10G0043600 [Buddleja alternifolia]